MREYGYEQTGLIRHRKECGDSNRIRTSGSTGGHLLVPDRPAAIDIRVINDKTVFVLHPGERGLERSYRKVNSTWDRWEVPLTPRHGSSHWMAIPDWSVPEEIIELTLE